MKRTKDCPVQPCPVRIGAYFLACGYHWGFVPDQVRREFKTAVRSGDSTRKMIWAVRALASIWTVIDEVGVTMPQEHRPFGLACSCPSCSANEACALRALDIGKPLFDVLVARRPAA